MKARRRRGEEKEKEPKERGRKRRRRGEKKQMTLKWTYASLKSGSGLLSSSTLSNPETWFKKMATFGWEEGSMVVSNNTLKMSKNGKKQTPNILFYFFLRFFSISEKKRTVKHFSEAFTRAVLLVHAPNSWNLDQPSLMVGVKFVLHDPFREVVPFVRWSEGEWEEKKRRGEGEKGRGEGGEVKECERGGRVKGRNITYCP